MAEEPRPLMYEVGVEGDRFHPHRKDAYCATAGCVPVTPQPDDTRDAARWRWVVALATGRVPFGGGLWGAWEIKVWTKAPTFTDAVDAAMAAMTTERPPTQQDEGEELPKINLNLTIYDVKMFAESQTFGEDTSAISDVDEFASIPLDPSEG